MAAGVLDVGVLDELDDPEELELPQPAARSASREKARAKAVRTRVLIERDT